MLETGETSTSPAPDKVTGQTSACFFTKVLVLTPFTVGNTAKHCQSTKFLGGELLCGVKGCTLFNQQYA